MFGFLPHNLFTNHVGQNTSGLSPRLWSRVSGTMMASDGDKRLVLAGDDFTTVGFPAGYLSGAAETGYLSYIDTGGTITGLSDEKGGVIALTSDATDEDEIWLSSGAGALGTISDTAGDDHLTAFECRVKFGSIAAAEMTSFIGLATPGAAAERVVDATGVLKTDDAFIGLTSPLLLSNTLDFSYQAASQTLTQVIDEVKVPVADTFIKFGFVYDPDAPTDKRITAYLDNVEQSTYVTGTQIAAATFPDAEALAFLAGFKNTTAVATEMAIDWWAFAQVIT